MRPIIHKLTSFPFLPENRNLFCVASTPSPPKNCREKTLPSAPFASELSIKKSLRHFSGWFSLALLGTRSRHLLGNQSGIPNCPRTLRSTSQLSRVPLPLITVFRYSLQEFVPNTLCKPPSTLPTSTSPRGHVLPILHFLTRTFSRRNFGNPLWNLVDFLRIPNLPRQDLWQLLFERLSYAILKIDCNADTLKIWCG